MTAQTDATTAEIYAAAWRAEIRRRIDDIESGRAKPLRHDRTSRCADHPAAREEYAEAIRVHQQVSPQLGEAITRCLENAVQAVLVAPMSWPVFSGWDEEPVVRNNDIDRCAYRIVHYQRGDETVILAYALKHQPSKQRR